jgi:hypothetical protein
MDKCYRSCPNFFLCGHPPKKSVVASPVHALPHEGKTGILRNINSPDILIQANPGMVRTIAHFVMERFVNWDLIKSNHFPAKKMMVWYDSMLKNRVATKIFIN